MDVPLSDAEAIAAFHHPRCLPKFIATWRKQGKKINNVVLNLESQCSDPGLLVQQLCQFALAVMVFAPLLAINPQRTYQDAAISAQHVVSKLDELIGGDDAVLEASVRSMVVAPTHNIVGEFGAIPRYERQPELQQGDVRQMAERNGLLQPALPAGGEAELGDEADLEAPQQPILMGGDEVRAAAAAAAAAPAAATVADLAVADDEDVGDAAAREAQVAAGRLALQGVGEACGHMGAAGPGSGGVPQNVCAMCLTSERCKWQNKYVQRIVERLLEPIEQGHAAPQEALAPAASADLSGSDGGAAAGPVPAAAPAATNGTPAAAAAVAHLAMTTRHSSTTRQSSATQRQP